MEFKNTDYKLKTNDGDDILSEAWSNGIRYFKILHDGKEVVKEARKTPHFCDQLPEEPIKLDNPLLFRIESLEARIAQLENKLDNKLDKVK